MALNTLLTGLAPRLGQTVRFNGPPQNQPRQNPQQQNSPNSRPSVIQRNPNFQSNPPRTHHVNSDNYYFENENTYYNDQCDDYYTANNHESYEYNSGNDEFNCNYPIDVDSNYQDFLSLPSQDNPPGYANHSTNQLSEIQSQFKTLNLNEFHPDLNFPEQTFL
ncbi:hypothetical protein NQ318_018983 [Aromia moschata]|uniref:Uncharacterized protein n=1 Tax=Aromia moschata TaxID=1265417 RepID=A0AAV8Y5Q2_9CUCU|nr:hypothetical protein NQ318_018983 [Aromia moschata]